MRTMYVRERMIMPNLIEFKPLRTYQTREKAERAITKRFPDGGFNYSIFVNEEDGTYFPVAFGEKALQAMVHFQFNVLG